MIYIKAMLYRGKEVLQKFMKEESGIGVLEIILIIVVLIGLVIIFSEQLNTIIQNIFTTINGKIDEIQ